MTQTIAEPKNLFPVNTIPVQGDLYAAGPITRQPASMPYRLVLVRTGDDFVVYSQIFRLYPDNSVNWHEYDYSHGNYFTLDQFGDAVKCFGERVSKESAFMASLYR